MEKSKKAMNPAKKYISNVKVIGAYSNLELMLIMTGPKLMMIRSAVQAVQAVQSGLEE